MEDYKAKREKAMKQTKAKESQDKKRAKVDEEPASGGAQAAPKAVLVKAPPPTKVTQMSKVVDQTNLDYYTKVQEDMRVVLKSLGSAFGAMAALPIAELNHEGKGGVQARFCGCCKDVFWLGH